MTLLLKRAEAEGDGAQGDRAPSSRGRRRVDERSKDNDRAIALYEEILEQEPTRRPSRRTRLRALYGELGKYNELAKLLRHARRRRRQSPEARAALRIDLAKLQLEKFENPRDAADTLRAVLEEDPDHEGASSALAAIYEKTEQYAELAELWTQLVERARARGDADLELDSHGRRSAEIIELA